MSEEKVLAEARALVDRGLLSPSEWPTIRKAGLILLQNGRQLTRDDHQILTFCRGVWGRGWNEEPEPPPPTPFDSDIEELERQVEELKRAHASADEARWQAVRAWALLTGQNGYAGHGLQMFGLLSLGDERVKVNDGGELFKALDRPASKAAVNEAEMAIGEAVRALKERQHEWQRGLVRLNKLKRQQSLWRATEPGRE